MPDNACPQDPFTARGRIVLSKNARFKHLEFSFPLKLMAPRLHSALPNLGVCYVLSFGGGLVSGDTVLLRVEVEPDCSLLMLTQVR
jgi:urease accessory protein